VSVAQGFDVLSIAAHSAYRRGDWEDAAQLWRSALAQDEASGDRWNQFWRLFWLGRLQYKLQELDECEALLGRAVQTAETSSYVICELWARPLHALALFALGRVDDGALELERCREL